jgi:transposase
MARLQLYFPKSHWRQRVDDRRVLSGIIFVNRDGIRWCDTPKEYGPSKTLYNRWKRWDDKGLDDGRSGYASSSGVQDDHDRRDLPQSSPAHRTASSLRVKKGAGRLIGRTKGGMNAKLHAVTDANGRPISFFMAAGQVSNYAGATAWLDELPKAKWLLADRGYDADRFRDALQAKGINPCIPGRKSRNKTAKYDKRRYKRRNRIGIMCGGLKNWRRVATRYDRCSMAFFSAIALAATAIFWL